MEGKKLYKSSTDKMVWGVCGGLGAYFTIDPTVLRIAWVGIALITLPAGPAGLFIGALAYLAAGLILPANPNEAGLIETQSLTTDDPLNQEEPMEKDIQSNNLIWGAVLVLLALIVLSNMDGLPFHLHWGRGGIASVVTLAVIFGGVYWVLKNRPQVTELLKGLTGRRLYKSKTNKKLFGVCGGLAESFEVDPTLVRLGWAFAAMLTGGVAIPIYLIMAFAMPDGGPEKSPQPGHWS